jgi:MscS family membrane protein
MQRGCKYAANFSKKMLGQLPLKSKRIFSALLVASLGLILILASPTFTKSNIKINLPSPKVEYIPFEEQPIYRDIQVAQLQEDKSIIDAAAIRAPLPGDTVVNYYSRIAKLYDMILPYYTHSKEHPGRLFWDSKTKEEFRLIGMELAEVATTFDVSELPQSIRESAAEHRAIQLKQVFDYIFKHATETISLDDQPKSGLWEFPQSPITLSDQIIDSGSTLPIAKEYQFTADTVKITPELYYLTKDYQPLKNDNQFYTPDFYKLITETPGRLIAPKWYLELPANVRTIIDRSIGENTLIEIALAAGIIFIYIVFSGTLIRYFTKTYETTTAQYDAALDANKWISLEDKEAWTRLVILGIFILATQIARSQIIQYANITGNEAVFILYAFSCIFYASMSFGSFLLLEAVGRVICDAIVHSSQKLTMADLDRIAGSVMPASRLIGVLLSIFYIYNLLLALGLPGSTILAFASVPGLAIGLGASKMLSNLMAGFVIQADRPLQVGDFCEVGGNKGFVNAVGLRSIRLAGPTATITVPNSKVDEANVTNYTQDKLLDNGTKIRIYKIDLSKDFELIHDQDRLDCIKTDLQVFLESFSTINSIILKIKTSLTGGPARLICFVWTTSKNWGEHDAIVTGFNNKVLELDGHYPGSVPTQITNFKLIGRNT